MENINVLRRQEMATKEIIVGDRILVSLAELGDFTATAHKITDRGVLFIFDEYVTSRPMNSRQMAAMVDSSSVEKAKAQ